MGQKWKELLMFIPHAVTSSIHSSYLAMESVTDLIDYKASKT